MHTNLSPKALRTSPKYQTLLTEANTEYSNTFTPKMLSWNQITHNPRWNLEGAFKPSIENPKLTQIVENEDKSVEIQFQSQTARLELPRIFYLWTC